MTAFLTETPGTSIDPQQEHLSYISIFRATPLERIKMIKQGVLATEAKWIVMRFAFGQGQTLKALNIPQATLNKKAKQNLTLSANESERIIGFARLIGQLEAMIEQSGNPQGFDAIGWMSAWLNAPVSALGGAKPIDLMDTMEGQALVSTTLAQMDSGAYA